MITLALTKLRGLIAAMALVSAAVAGQDALAESETATDTAPRNRVVSVDEIQWSPLNPARGDASPRAGTLWGDRDQAIPTGFLAHFADGFSSPPHIHNVTYRAVVISGTIHNDDPEAEPMWMPAGSFWTQPAGESHITAARGERNIALVEIDHGPYRVMPTDQAFDEGERPINVDASNLVWLPLPVAGDPGAQARIAYLWGQLEPSRSRGVFLEIPAGFTGSIETSAPTLHAVVIHGALDYGPRAGKTLEPGSYFGSNGEFHHRIRALPASRTVLYLRTDDDFRIARGSQTPP